MRTVINDTCDVVAKRLSDGVLMFTATAQIASFAQKVKTDRIKGGIGNRDIAVLRSEKTVDLKIKDAVFDSAWLEMVTGAKYTSQGMIVFKRETVTCALTGKVNISLTPTSSTTASPITLFSANGVAVTGTTTAVNNVDPVKGAVVSNSTLVLGKIYTILYQIDVVGNVLDLDVTKFSERFYIEYSTIEYDLDTAKVTADIYLQFDSVQPDDTVTLLFENGKAINPDMSFIALPKAGLNEIGRIIEVPRVVE